MALFAGPALLIGPLEMLYARGVKKARKRKQIVIKDYEKKWAVKKKTCTLNTQQAAFDMEEDYEIIGEFDLWSETMKCRNDVFESLPLNTFCGIDDPEATHYTISRGSKNQPFTRDTEFVKLWCVFNIDFLQDRIKEVEKLQAQQKKLEKELKSVKFEQSKKGNKRKSNKQASNIKSLKKKIKNLKKEIFKKRHVMPPGFDPRNPNSAAWPAPNPETTDSQPGTELRYVYHRENDFVPNGFSMYNEPNGPSHIQFNVRPHATLQPPSDDEEDQDEAVDNRQQNDA